MHVKLQKYAFYSNSVKNVFNRRENCSKCGAKTAAKQPKFPPKKGKNGRFVTG